MQFEEAAKRFRLIDDNTTSIVVNWKKKGVLALMRKLQTDGFSYYLMKEIAQYSVNIRQHDLMKLKEFGVIEEVVEGVLFIRDMGFYNDDIGLVVDNHWLEESLIV